VCYRYITSRNFKFLDRDTLPPPDEIGIDPPSQGESSPSEGGMEPTLGANRVFRNTTHILGFASSEPNKNDDL